MRLTNLAILGMTFATLSSCGTAQAPAGNPAGGGSDPETAALQAKIRQFAPTDISADLSTLPENERRALAKMVEAAQLVDGLVLQQAWADHPSMLARSG